MHRKATISWSGTSAESLGLVVHGYHPLILDLVPDIEEHLTEVNPADL